MEVRGEELIEFLSDALIGVFIAYFYIENMMRTAVERLTRFELRSYEGE